MQKKRCLKCNRIMYYIPKDNMYECQCGVKSAGKFVDTLKSYEVIPTKLSSK